MFLVLSMFPIGLRLDSLPLSDNLSLAAAIFIFHRKREKNRNGKVSNSEIFLIQFLPVFYSLRSSIQRFLRSSIQRFFIQFIWSTFDNLVLNRTSSTFVGFEKLGDISLAIILIHRVQCYFHGKFDERYTIWYESIPRFVIFLYFEHSLTPFC